MAYQFANIRGNEVAKSRVPHIARGYATGGAVHDDVAADTKLVKKMVKPAALKMEGGVAKARADRPGRARGGRSPKHKGNNVNVIIAPQGGVPPSPAAGVAGPIPPTQQARPAMPPPIPGPPPGVGGPMPPPGLMPPRASGGRAYAKGGAVGAYPDAAFKEGKRNGTKVQPLPMHNDAKNMNRKKPVTFKTGGPVFASPTGQHGPKFIGGNGGLTRLQEAARARKNYAKPAGGK